MERDKEKEITKWLKQHSESFQSQYGKITNPAWLIKEKYRIESGTGRECVILTNNQKRQCLAYI